jgi:hypothetical protein
MKQDFLISLFQKAAGDFRIDIAYASAFVLLTGTVFLFIRSLVVAQNPLPSQIRATRPFQKAKRKNRIAISLLYAATLAFSILLFFLTSFPYAFTFASGLMIYSLLKCKKDEKKLFFLALFIVFLFWSAFLFQGQDSHVKIFDNLDCHIPQSKVLAESGKAFSLNPDTRLDNFTNGLPLSGVDSGYNVLTWLLMIFPPFVAYAINDLLVRLVAFAGMILFLKKYIVVPKDEEHHWIIIGCSLCFALLPFYPAGGLSISGFPLLLYCFLNIMRREEKKADFVVIFLFPFYSRLALAGIFITIIFLALFLIDCLKRRNINFYLGGALILFILTYSLTHFHLVHSFLSPEFVSFRREIQVQPVATGTALQNTISNFIFDRVNVVGAHHLFVLGAAALAVLTSIVKKIKATGMALLVMTALGTSIMWGFKYWEGIISIRQKAQFLNAFDFSRFYWFNPFLWGLIFALALLTLSKVKYGNKLVTLLIICQIMFLFINYNWEYRFLLGIKKSFAGSPITYSLTYRDFFSESLFAEISQYLESPQKDYRIVCIGIHPGIASYNGFFTLDIYTDIYPLDYKHRFRQIIEREIEKSPELTEVFDHNAKRCYLLTAELHGDKTIRGLANARGITKNEQYLKIRDLDLNTTALKEMGGEYIFSGVEIVNHRENNLQFERIFENEKSPWKIYLYRVI